jgi:anti-sigma-K factor RskA
MNYADPKLRELLAGEYVLGTMPWRARARFERLMRDDANLRRLVGEWEEHFSALDAATPAETPPARVWQGIVAALPPAAPAPAAADRAPGPWRSLGLWRGIAAGCFALAALLIVYINVLRPLPPGPPTVVAVLNDQDGKPAWIATTGSQAGQIVIAALAPQPLAEKHSFELWGIAGGPPKSLGILPPEPTQHLTLAANQVPGKGGVLAVTLEPEGGSPTGKATGPIVYKGQVLVSPTGT